MSQFKTILCRVVLYLATFQVLNISIDIDYVVQGMSMANIGSYDDIDSFTELLVEQFAGDDHLFEETDFEHGNPFDTENARFETDQWDGPTRLMPKQAALVPVSSTWPTGMQLQHITCRGYQDIITPPPDRV